MTLQPAIFTPPVYTVCQGSFKISWLIELKGKRKENLHNRTGISKVPEPTVGDVGEELVTGQSQQPHQ